MKKTRLAVSLTVVLALAFLTVIRAGQTPSAAPADPPFPAWVFGHVVWEDESTTARTYELVQGYLERGIPVDGMIIDSPWETAYNTFEADPQLYPNMKQLIDDFHDNGIHTIFWITPNVNLDDPEYQYALDQGFLVKGMENVTWWKGPGGWLDYDNPRAVEWWHKRMDKAIDLGIDGWKCDGTDPYVLIKGWNDRKRYSQAYYSDFFDYTRERTGRKTVIMARPLEQVVSERTFGLSPQWNPLGTGVYFEYAPVDRSFMSWVGDQDPTLDGMKLALRWVLDSARANYLIVGSDVGGYREGGPDKETLIRWAQFGALCPFLENGGGGEHRPWMFDEETLRIYRAYALLHKALAPYFYTEAVAAWREGRSIMKPLKVGKDEYLLGRDILVAPIVESGGKVKVVLPQGDDWMPLFADAAVFAAAAKCRVPGDAGLLRGGCSYTHTYPLSQYPVFLRAGAVVPLDLTYARALLGDAADQAGGADRVLLAVPAAGGPARVQGVVYEEGKAPLTYSGLIDGGSCGVSSEPEAWPVVVAAPPFPVIPEQAGPIAWK